MLDKKTFIKKLDEYLTEKNVSKDDILQILEDYRDLYDQGLEQGLTNVEIEDKLGNPKQIYEMLKKDLSHEFKTNKLTGLSVFIAIIIFVVLGSAFDLWRYSWIAFLLIPVTGILTTTKIKKSLPGLMVFISLAVFMIFGQRYNVYHPLWLVFLSIPVAGILTSNKKSEIPVALSPFIALTIYMLISYYNTDFYKIGWLLFLMIPFLGALTKPITLLKLTLALLILLSVIAYLILVYSTGEYGYSLLVFLVPLIFALFTGDFVIKIVGLSKEKDKYLILAILLIVTIYLVTSLLTSAWGVTWLILMLIPMSAIFYSNRFKNIVAYMPFISLILFILTIRYIPNSSSWAWLFFLMIPMTGILESDKNSLVKAERKTIYEDDELIEDEEESLD